MSRKQAKTAAENPRWAGGDPTVYTASGVRSASAFLRELLFEVDGISKRMKDRGVESISLPPGNGAAGYDRAEKAIRAWTRGLWAAFYAAVREKDPGEEPEEETR